MTEDEKRLAYLRHEIDEIGGIDLHERADYYRQDAGRERLMESDYVAAVRDAIDQCRPNAEAQLPPERAARREPKARQRFGRSTAATCWVTAYLEFIALR